MNDNTELFRQEFISNLLNILTEEELDKVLTAFDITSSGYDISHKKMEIIVTGGMPEAVKWFIASKAVENCSVKTLAQYKYKLINFFKVVNKPITDVTTNDIRLYLYSYKQNNGVGNHTLEHTRICLNTFFAWCVKNHLITVNPVENVEKIKFQQTQRQPLTAYQLEVLRWNCKTEREKALIDFLFSTGCRISECADVKLSDINWEERAVHIRHGKGDKERYVFFNAESELSLRNYLNTRNDECDGLFVSIKKPIHNIQAHALENIVKDVSKRANIHVYPHRLRHTFATTGLNGGMPIEKLQQLLGHVNPATTMIYAKLDQTDLQMEHKRIYQ